MRKQLQTNSLVFVLWICLAIIIHFALTCAIIHPVEVTLPVTMVEQNDSSVEAFLVKAKTTPAQTEATAAAKETPKILRNKESAVTERLVEEPATFREEQSHAFSDSTQSEAQNTQKKDTHVNPAPPDELVTRSNRFLENTLETEGNFSAESEGARNRMMPSAVKSPAPRYPIKAKNEGRSGITQLRVTIDGSGRPTDVGIEASSGHEDLDERACDTVRKRWRFSAPEGGRLVKTTFLVEVKFKLTA